MATWILTASPTGNLYEDREKLWPGKAAADLLLERMRAQAGAPVAR
jgi:hypothetical protein